jgi:hypothetical protein
VQDLSTVTDWVRLTQDRLECRRVSN